LTNLAAFGKALRDRGMKFDVLLHVVKNPFMARENPICPRGHLWRAQKHGLCPNNPNVRATSARWFEYRHEVQCQRARPGQVWHRVLGGRALGEGWYTSDEGGTPVAADIDPEFLHPAKPLLLLRTAKNGRAPGGMTGTPLSGPSKRLASAFHEA
jgi:hypothetical protein